MDIVGAITASRHCNRVCVTVGVDNVEFHAPIKEGSIVILQAKVTRAFNTSMEVKIKVFSEEFITGKRQLCNEAYYTFVAVDQVGRPIPVNPVEPETEEEKKEYEEALKRRELRLLLAGRLQPGQCKFFILKQKDDGPATTD
jgi:acyl-CoA hydrolase